MKYLSRMMILWFFIGMVYYTIEGVWRIRSNGGWANIVMLVIGGLCGLVVGTLNHYKFFYTRPVIIQCFIGAITTLIIEFISGCVVNLWLGMNVWDYSNLPLNIMGQVCLLYGIIWFFIMPFAIWMEDMFSYTYFQYGKPYTLGTIYIETFTLKKQAVLNYIPDEDPVEITAT